MPGIPITIMYKSSPKRRKRCEKLVQELLEFGRPKSAEFALTDVEQIIRKTFDLMQNHAGKKQVETVTRVGQWLPRDSRRPATAAAGAVEFIVKRGGCDAERWRINAWRQR